MRKEGFDYRLILKSSSDTIEKNIINGYTFSIDKLGKIIEHKYKGRIYIQMERPQTLEWD